MLKRDEFNLSTKSEFTEIHFHGNFTIRWFNPPKELTYIDVGRLIHLDFRNASAWNRHCGRYDVLETTEGHRTTKHHKVSQSTIRYYSVLQRTTTYKVLRRTTKYLLLHTRKYYAVLQSIPPYYKVLLRTTKYYQCILHGKIQHFALRRSPRNLTTCCRKWLSNITKCCVCHKKCHRFLSWLLLYCSFPVWPAPFLNYSIPFLNLSFTLLSIPLLDISLTEHSFLNCSFTELAFDELCLYCTLLLPNYSSTELVLSWTIPFLNYALFLPFKSS